MEALVELGKRNCFRILLCPPAAHLGKLFIGEPQRAVVLLFHQLHYVRQIGLPLRRPTQHAIKNHFHLVSCHARHYSTRLNSRIAGKAPRRAATLCPTILDADDQTA